MEIKTKFNIGDIIWHTERSYNEEIDDFEVRVCPCPKKIARIDICCWKVLYLNKNEITYLTEYLDGATDIQHLREGECFGSREEAEKYVREVEYGK